VSGQDFLAAAPTEWRMPGEQLVAHRTHRVDVHPVVEVRIGRGLFRRHVRRCPQCHARGSELVPAARLAERLRHAEIHHQGVAAGEHHIVGLDITVYDTQRVRGSQGVHHLRQDLDRLIYRELPHPVQPLAQRLSRDVRHNVEAEAGGLAGVEQREDVRVLQSRRDFDFAEESVAAQGHGQLGPKHLHRDLAVMPDVPRQINGGHPPAPELPLEHIAVAEGVGEERIDCSHERAWRG
jgi:hypothetical protein